MDLLCFYLLCWKLEPRGGLEECSEHGVLGSDQRWGEFGLPARCEFVWQFHQCIFFNIPWYSSEESRKAVRK